MARGPLPVLVLAALLPVWGGASSCRSEVDPGPPAHVRFSLARSPLRFGDVPFPSDLHRTTGHVDPIEGFDAIVGAHADALRDNLATLDAFGRTTAVHFFVDGTVPLDASSLAGHALLVDVEDGPTKGRSIPVEAEWIGALRCISVIPAPGQVLLPGRRYAAILTTAVRTTDGRPLAPSTEFAGLLAKTSRATAAEKLHGEALDAILAARVSSTNEVVGMAVYTTSRAVYELPTLRDRLSDAALPAPHLFLEAASAAPFPVAIFGRTTSPSLDEWLGIPKKDAAGFELPGGDADAGIAHEALGVVASGSFEAPSFLDPTSHHFEREGTLFRVANAVAKVPITIAVPNAPPPAEGYPVVLVSHGLGSTRATVLAVANEFARAGFVTVGIDDVEHGSRAGTADTTNEFAGTYRGPDGIPDRDTVAGLSFFAGFTGLAAMRDNFRQTVLDHASVVRLLRSPVLDLSPLAPALGGRVPKLDPRWIFWTGGSFGGINGATTAAVEPSIAAFALEVPGGGWAHYLIPHSPQMSTIVMKFVRTAYGVDDGDTPLDSFHPLNNLVAQVVEAGDPLAYAPHVAQMPFDFGGKPRATPANVLITYALDDEVLPNLATRALVTAMGLTQVGPSQRPFPGLLRAEGPFASTKGLLAAVEYAPASHGLGYSRIGEHTYLPRSTALDALDGPELLPRPYKFAMPIREHLAQLVHFFVTTMAGKPEIILTAPSRADADGDGVLDEDERKKGTDPNDPTSH